MADEMNLPEPERGVLPDDPAPGRVEPETGIEPDDEVADERVKEFEGVGTPAVKTDGPAPSGA